MRIKKTYCTHGHEIAVVGRDTSGGCKACHCIHQSNYRSTPKGKLAHNIYEAIRRVTPKGKACRDAWYALPEVKAHLADYHATYRSTHKEARISYRKKNPEKIKGWKARRRARKLKANIETFNEKEWFQLQFLYQDGRCFYCKEILTTWHIDHMSPLFRGGRHSKDNLCLSCPTCNRRKHTKTTQEFQCQII